MAYRTTERFTVGDSYCLGASFPNYVPLPPVPSLSKRNLFAIFVLYGPIYDVAGDLNRLDVSASGRKETRASPICFWWRRFGEPLRNRFRVAALADCWRLRFDSSRRPRAPRTWIHLNRIYKKQLEEKNGTGGPNRSTGGGRIDFSITRSCSRIASTASCDLRLWPIEK